MTEGVWEGRLAGADEPPEISVTHWGVELAGVELRPAGKQAWTVRIPVPVEALSDGLQTFLITERRSGARLGRFSIVAGAPLDDDLAAEIDLLRAELDALRKAFRRLAAKVG